MNETNQTKEIVNEINSQLKVKVYSDCGVKITFDVCALQEWQFQALLKFVSTNSQMGNFIVSDLFLDENEMTNIAITKVINKDIPELMSALQAELLQVFVPEFVMGNLIVDGNIAQ